MIARELLDRGIVQRLCVLCPAYLCDQWERELRFPANGGGTRTTALTERESARPAAL